MDDFLSGLLTGWISAIGGFSFYYWASNPRRQAARRAYNRFYGIRRN